MTVTIAWGSVAMTRKCTLAVAVACCFLGLNAPLARANSVKLHCPSAGTLLEIVQVERKACECMDEIDSELDSELDHKYFECKQEKCQTISERKLGARGGALPSGWRQIFSRTTKLEDSALSRVPVRMLINTGYNSVKCQYGHGRGVGSPGPLEIEYRFASNGLKNCRLSGSATVEQPTPIATMQSCGSNGQTCETTCSK